MGKRRRKGDGSIFQAQNGTWRGYVTLSDGRRKYVSAGTRKECADKLKALQATIDRGVDVSQPDVLLSDYLRYWLTEIVQRYRSANTYAMRRQAIETKIIPSIGHIRLARLSQEHCQTFVNMLADSGMAPGTLAIIKATLSAALMHAVKSGRLERSPMRYIEVPKNDGFKGKAMTPEEATRFLSACEKTRHKHLFRFLLLTGARIGEAFALRWSDYNSSKQTLRLDGKTGARDIGLSPEVVTLLRKQRIYVNEMRLAAPMWNDHDLIFPSDTGRMLIHQNIRATFKSMLSLAGVAQVFRVHDLRHTCVSLLSQANVPLKKIMDFVGHTQA